MTVFLIGLGLGAAMGGAATFWFTDRAKAKAVEAAIANDVQKARDAAAAAKKSL